MLFVKENSNPKGWKIGDCVIRACAYATEKSWDEVYTSLYEIAFKKKRMLSDDCVVNKYLTDNGFVKMPMLKDVYGDKLTVRELVEKYEDKGTLVIHTRRHLTTSVNGIVKDTWDTSRQNTGYYYFKQ